MLPTPVPSHPLCREVLYKASIMQPIVVVAAAASAAVGFSVSYDGEYRP